MAKKTDGMTRLARRLVKEGRAHMPNIDRVNQRFPNWTKEEQARARYRGRRGVRARARQQRIIARMNNGTYQQPGGGDGSNS